MIGFAGEVPADAQVIVDNFTGSHDIDVQLETNLGFSEQQLHEALVRTYKAVREAPRVLKAWGSSGDGDIIITVEMSLETSDSRFASLQTLAQAALESDTHTSMNVQVVKGIVPVINVNHNGQHGWR